MRCGLSCRALILLHFSGLFLYDVLSDLDKWYKDASAYQSEAIGAQLGGFQRNLAEKSTTKSFYEHAELQAALLKWHGYMVQVCLLAFLPSLLLPVD